MKTTPRTSFVLVAMLFAFLIPVDNLIAEEPTTPSSTIQAAGKAEIDEATETIRWSFLAPENGKPFNDPFAKLTQDQLSDLSYVVRVQRLLAEKKLKANGVDAKEAAQLARKLTTEGVDIGWLMAQRERIQQIRSLQVESFAKSIADSLADKNVTLTGYVIPIKMNQERLAEFFLVPTAAACSHEDAPPRLQVVFIATEQGIAPPDRRTPVRVTGKVVADTTTRTTFNGNGRVAVHSAYAMSSPDIEVFQAAKKSGSRSKR